MKPAIDLPNAKVFFGSCLDVLPTLADNSVDAIVTDPPYELGFMGKSWDNSGIAYNVDVWRECLRVLKPGGHILAFGGSRTWHRLAVAIEDSGFEMRDSIAWLYGSGFPKSHNISKAIDKLHGAERTVVGRNPNSRENATKDNTLYESGTVGKTDFITAAATDDAKQWDGWGTALKPAFEPIVVGRKPLVGTVAENVLEWGVGGLNIDATRVGTETVTINTFDNGAKPFGDAVGEPFTSRESVGRWPANIILDEHTAELLDEQSGISKSGKAGIRTSDGFNANSYGSGMGIKAGQANGEFGDKGGASRFFYVAKANKKDRNEGLDDLVAQESAGKGNGLGRLCAICGASILKPCECPDRTFVNPPKQNFHPTVKPTALMQYLVRLVTPEGGTVLDPFTGSGSTGKAAILEGKQFIGIELTEEYLPIIAGRLEHAINTSEEKEDDLFASL
jgi:site-specific DNA-methyltransferase (adenine-specific)